MTARRYAGLAITLLVLVAGGRVAADEREQRQRDAEAEFRRGVACGPSPCACLHFKRSVLLYDERPSAWVRVALCRSQDGDNAGAWRALQKARELNRAAEQYREDLEQEIKAELELIPTLTIEVDDPPRGIELFVDGARVPEAPGEAVGVWRGKHELRAEAPGYEVTTASVVVDELRERVKLELVATSKPVPPLDAVASSEPVRADAGSGSVAAYDEGVTQRTAGYTLGAAGVVGLGIGAFFGIKALRLVSDSNPHCDARDQCDDQGIRLRERASDAQTIGIVASIAGGLALGGGLVLLLTAPDGTRAEAAQAPPRLDLVLTGAGVQARAHW